MAEILHKKSGSCTGLFDGRACDPSPDSHFNPPRECVSRLSPTGSACFLCEGAPSLPVPGRALASSSDEGSAAGGGGVAEERPCALAAESRGEEFDGGEGVGVSAPTFSSGKLCAVCSSPGATRLPRALNGRGFMRMAKGDAACGPRSLIASFCSCAWQQHVLHFAAAHTHRRPSQSPPLHRQGGRCCCNSCPPPLARSRRP